MRFRRISNVKVIIPLILALSLALIVACGSAADPEDTTSDAAPTSAPAPQATSAPAATAAPAADIRSGGHAGPGCYDRACQRQRARRDACAPASGNYRAGSGSVAHADR